MGSGPGSGEDRNDSQPIVQRQVEGRRKRDGAEFGPVSEMDTGLR